MRKMYLGTVLLIASTKVRTRHLGMFSTATFYRNTGDWVGKHYCITGSGLPRIYLIAILISGKEPRDMEICLSSGIVRMPRMRPEAREAPSF